MEKFVIYGGKPLKGTIDVRGAKNAAFPILAATILTNEDCEIRNLPLIEDVYRFLEILEGIGAHVRWKGERAVVVSCKDINPALANRSDNKKLIRRLRGSILMLGPLQARFGKISFPQPGGCVIGARPIDTHSDGLSQARKHQDVVLNEFSVTATENVLLFASLKKRSMTLKIADQDYQVQELASVLNKMGAQVVFSGMHEIMVKGSAKLKGFSHTLIADPIEAGTFIVMAAATKGDVTVHHVEVQYLDLFLKKLKDFGVPLTVSGKRVRVRPWKKLRIDKIQSFIYPGIHSDLQSVLGVLATQAEGSTLLHDPLYEGRLKYLEEINKMGAEIYVADPHRAIINGPTRLFGTDLGTFDLRGGAALITAALVAKGKSTINNIYQVDRGYEKIEERLRGLGADIKRI